MRAGLVALFLLTSTSLACASELVNGYYQATAYAQHGITASGEYVHRHVVAADPDILPIGSRIKIKHAGRYSGEYVVADTGDKIQGRRLDIYMPSAAACKKFGVKRVTVRAIELGDGTHAAAKQADQAVKQDVAVDVQKKVVGNSATEDDWVKAKATGQVSVASDGQAAGAQVTGAKTPDLKPANAKSDTKGATPATAKPGP